MSKPEKGTLEYEFERTKGMAKTFVSAVKLQSNSIYDIEVKAGTDITKEQVKEGALKLAAIAVIDHVANELNMKVEDVASTLYVMLLQEGVIADEIQTSGSEQ